MKINYKKCIMKDEQFFNDLGKRIAELRQKAGLSQQDLADKINLKQQTLATYESATRRLPSSLLIPLSNVFNISFEELLGIEPRKQKRGPAPKLERQLQAVSALPKSQQKFVSQFLDTVLQAESAS